VVNANLLSVVRLLQVESGAQIVVVSGDYSPVTAKVSASLPDVLRYVASSANATVNCDTNGVYTIRPEGAPLPADDVQQPVAAAAPATDDDAIPESSLHTERIPIQNVDPNYILIMIGDTEDLRNYDPSTNPIDNSPLADANDLPRITPGSAGIQMQGAVNESNTQAQQPSVPASNNNYSNGSVSQSNQYVPGGSEANQFPGGGFQGSGNSFNPFQNGGAGAQPNQNFPTGAPGANGVNGGRNLRPQGIQSIIANEEDNSIIVRGTADGIAKLKQIITFIDRAPKQVEIKLEYITANTANADTFGINWDIIPFPNVGVAFNGPGLDGTQGSTSLNYAQGNMVAQMEALLTKSNGKVIEAPIITTTNNTPASFNFSTEIPYETTTTVAQSGGNAVSGTQVNFLQIPNSLTIVPRINGDDSVSMLISPTISTAGTPPFSGAPPPVSQQSVRSYRTVANGETMVIGGLVNKQTTNSSEEVPFLSKLPIIGSLFRTRDLNVSDTELYVFVTPTVLPPIGADVAESNANPGSSDNSGAGLGVTP
jgi:general secretion pathway protein D